jgi:hypothetical protein
MIPRYQKWFLRQSHDDQIAIALSAIEKLIADGKVAFWMDDYIDKFGNKIPDDVFVGEHLYWNDDHKEDLRIPF